MKAILERDFFQFAKRKRYYSMRTLAVALPLGILLLAMSVADLRDDQLGEFVFATTAWPIVCFAALLSPGMTAGLLVEERRDNRLDVLRSTPMAAWQIVVGRWFSRVALLWTMILAALPLCASSLLFSGVSPGQFLDVAVIALLTVPLFSSLALLVSSGGGDLGAVQRTANSLTIALLILPILGLGGFLRGSRDVIRDIVLCVAALDPLVVLVSTIDGRSNANWPAPPLVLFVAMGAAVTFACVALSVRRITRPARVRRAREDAEGAPAAAAGPVAVGPPRRRRAETRFSRSLPRLWRSPASWLELRRGQPRPGRVRLVLFWTVFGLMELWFAASLIDARGSSLFGRLPNHVVALVLAFLFAVFAVATAGATAVHRDGTANTRDVLHASPLTSRSLGMAKVGGALRAARFWILVGVAHLVVGMLYGDIHPVTAAATFGLAMGMLFSLAGFSVRFGMTARTGARAIARVVGTVVGHMVVFPVIGVFFMMAIAEGDAAPLVFGHHPLYIVAVPIMIQESGDDLFLNDAHVVLLPLLYFVAFLWSALVCAFSAVPRTYEQLREDEVEFVPVEPA